MRYSILPVVIGDGLPFFSGLNHFSGLNQDIALHLAEAKAYKSGIVALRYVVRTAA